MVRDPEPVTDDEIEAAREKMGEQREDIREYLADELGGDPSDYDSRAYFQDIVDDVDGSEGQAVPDGGEGSE
ncbi:hypothetical protein GRX01_03925 [Halobaculum sp. WSA2]|uniref:Uncharacterized protein n=1 Tax=Halobaculum saliterrae TaxID=2073113 RepID=A0A6B0T1N5_9EURY|nr:hypothetical protein [Halobaculum saliterrae]MXR40499.1 hypothetical protein [Halobaculum saliterrae]